MADLKPQQQIPHSQKHDDRTAAFAKDLRNAVRHETQGDDNTLYYTCAGGGQYTTKNTRKPDAKYQFHA